MKSTFVYYHLNIRPEPTQKSVCSYHYYPEWLSFTPLLSEEIWKEVSKLLSLHIAVIFKTHKRLITKGTYNFAWSK